MKVKLWPSDKEIMVLSYFVSFVIIIVACELTYTFLKFLSCAAIFAEPHSRVSGVADLKTGGRWFDPRLGQYSCQRLMVVIATGLIPPSPLPVVATMVYGQAASGLERLLCGILVKRTPGKHG